MASTEDVEERRVNFAKCFVGVFGVAIEMFDRVGVEAHGDDATCEIGDCCIHRARR